MFVLFYYCRLELFRMMVLVSCLIVLVVMVLYYFCVVL